MGEVWNVASAVIMGFGGISGIFIIVVKVFGGMIADRLEKKYSLKFNKELANYKSGLDNKIYISKTKFDAEFEIYRELSKAFFELERVCRKMIPSEDRYSKTTLKARKALDKENFDNSSIAHETAQDVLYGNAPFIPLEIYSKYEKMLADCANLALDFHDLMDIELSDTNYQTKRKELKDYSNNIRINLYEYNNDIREYLSKLDVL